MRFDGKKPIEFTDETVALEEENLEEETKYKIKLDAPQSEPALGASSGEESLDSFDDAPADDTGFGDDEGGEEKPFDDDEPFDPGVEADEATDPEKFIQQLAGKLGTSLRKYNDERGEPDLDLEKYAINSVISASHTADMDENDQDDIIKKVKMSGAADDEGDEPEADFEEPAEDGFEEDPAPEAEAGFGDAELEENNVDLPNFTHNPNDFAADDLKRYYDATVTRDRDGLTGRVVRFDDGKLKVKITDGEHTGKIYYAYPSEITMADNLKMNLESDIFAENVDMKDSIKGKLDEMTQPAPVKPDVKPDVAPKTPSPRRKKIWETKPVVKPRPKMEENNTTVYEVNGKAVDGSSLEVDGVDTKDYPDFTDAYISYGLFMDGTEMSDEELDIFSDTYPEVVREMAFERFMS